MRKIELKVTHETNFFWSFMTKLINEFLMNSYPEFLNPFHATGLYQYPLKTSENLEVFWCFLAVLKETHGMKWVNVGRRVDNALMCMLLANVSNRYFSCIINVSIQVPIPDTIFMRWVYNLSCYCWFSPALDWCSSSWKLCIGETWTWITFEKVRCCLLKG